MLRNEVKRLQPCKHLLHSKCFQRLQNEDMASCPICRTAVTETEVIARKQHKKYNNQDRQRIVECANRGGDWVTLAQSLGIKYKTAYHWMRSGKETTNRRGGFKPKSLTEDQIGRIIEWIEEDGSLSLKQVKEKVFREFHESVCISTIGNYLEGQLFTLKQVHHQSVNMNTNENKQKRAEYVRLLNNYIQLGKQIVWIDETNFNLFCRRTRGRSRMGSRAVQHLPASRGPNIHLIGGISAAGVVLMEQRRGSFKSETANNWLRTLLQQWQDMGNQLGDLVIVCDNAPCHRTLETAIDGTTATLLRLGPYSPMLNPIEIIWSKIKLFVKAHLKVPNVVPPGVGEQRLLYLEEIINQAQLTIVGGDCARAVQHTTTFHVDALALNNMSVGL